MPRSALIFAAGFGTRMRPLTETVPKPLLPVAGRALLDHALALTDAAGLRTVVNTHYRGAQIAAHLAGRPDVLISHEPEILETGGGLRAARALLGPGPVATLNSDAVWTGANPFTTLRAGWDPARMGGRLLLVPMERARERRGPGDFTLDAEGRIRRGGDLVYTGAQILWPEGLEAIPERVFSLNLLWDRLIAEGRLFGAVHPGLWCDVGRPEGIAAAEAMLAGTPVGTAEGSPMARSGRSGRGGAA